MQTVFDVARNRSFGRKGEVLRVAGLVAIFEDEYVVATQRGLALIDVTAWGWITVVSGVLLSSLSSVAMRPRYGSAGTSPSPDVSSCGLASRHTGRVKVAGRG